MTQMREHSADGVAKRWVWLQRPFWIFVAAFLLRAGVAGELLLHNPLSWKANEPSAIASGLVQGHGFSSAFHDTSQPTAWLAPVYPTLLAFIFRIFGVTTAASAIVAILLNVVFGSLTAVALAQLAREQFSETAGVVAAGAWAIAPPLLFIPWLLWETCLSGLVMTFAFLTTLRLGRASPLRQWVWCGAIWSFAALLNPALLAPLPVLAVDAAFQSRRWKQTVLMLLVCLLGILPWTVRNFVTFGRIMPVRSNFWPEAYFGNVDFSVHPTGNTMLYQREGEVHFAADLKQRVLTSVRSNPKAFARLTAKRAAKFWMLPPQLQPYPSLLFLMAVAGVVMAWHRRKRWIGFASALVLYPLIYYITYTFARYRYPIEPLMYALAAYFLSELLARRGGLRPEASFTRCNSSIE
jgi:hypothetical protein